LLIKSLRVIAKTLKQYGKISKKKTIRNCKRKKDDEFYTLYEDISAEVSKYKEQLKGKRILCPCDWDESYNEEIVFKEENHIIETTMFRNNGSIKRVDIEKSKEKFKKDLNFVKCNFVKFLVTQADVYGIKSISVSGFNPATEEGIKFQNIDYSKYDLIITNPPFSQFIEFIEIVFRNKMEFIDISKTKSIPYNYAGLMGVPITFLQKYNPEQFEIVGFRKGDDGKDLQFSDGKQPFVRLIIRKRP